MLKNGQNSLSRVTQTKKLVSLPLNEARITNSKGELIAFVLIRQNKITFCAGKWVKTISLDSSLLNDTLTECINRTNKLL